METSGHVDWLSVTLPETFNFQNLFWERGHWQLAPYGWMGYSKRFFSQSGTQLLEGHKKTNSVHVIMPSDSLANARAQGVKDRSLLLFFITRGGKATRIDLAVDIFGGNLTVGDFSEAFQSGKVQSPARKALRTAKVGETGDTLYVGSFRSQRMLRIYDKKAETQVQDIDSWLRLELQLRHLRAVAASRAVANNQDERAAINTHIDQFFQWDNFEYVAALNGKRILTEDLPRQLPAFLQWLEKQVAPACARYERDYPESDTLALLRVWMDNWLRKTGGSGAADVDSQ